MHFAALLILLHMASMSYNILFNQTIPSANIENRCIFWKYETQIKIKNHIHAVPRSHYAFYDDFKFHNPPNHSYFYHPNSRDITRSQNDVAFRINNHYLEAYRTFVNGVGGLIFENAFYTMKEHDHWRNRERLRQDDGKVIGHCHELIVLAYHGMDVYGHAVEDLFAPLLMMPEDVRNNAKILGCGLNNLINEFLDLLEVPTWRRVFMAPHEYLAVDKIYTITDPQIYLSFYGISVMKLKRFFEEKYELSKIEATDYCFANRKEGRPRYMINMNDLIDAVKQKYPDIKWRALNDTLCPTLAQSAKAWSCVKFVYMPLGSNSIKTVFMKENTVCVVGYTVLDYSIIKFLTAGRVFSLQYKALNTSHWEGPGGYIDVNLAIKMIDRGLSVFETKKWPNIYD